MPEPLPPPARAQPPWWFRLVRALLNLALVVVLLLQILLFVRLSTHQPLQVPDFVREAIQRRLQMEGVSVQFSAMELSLSGTLCLRNPQIFLTGTPEPVAQADALLIEPDWVALFWTHKVGLSRVGLENASLYCPPQVSASGGRETIVSDFDLLLANAGGAWWQLDYLRAHILNARLLARGTFIIPPKNAAPAPMTTTTAPEPPPATAIAASIAGPPSITKPTLAERYLALARQVEDMQENFARVQNPVVAIRLDGQAPGTTAISVFAQMDGAQPPMESANMTLGQLWLRGSALWDGERVRSATPAVVWLQSLHFVEVSSKDKPREIVYGGPAWVRVQLADGPQGIFDRPPLVWWMISPVKIYGFAFDSMGVQWNLTAWPDLKLNYYATRDQYWLKANGVVRLKAQTMGLDFDAFVDPGVVLAAARQQVPKELQSLKFAQPPRLTGNMTLASGFKPEVLNFVLQTQGTQYDRINLYALQAKGRLTTTQLDVTDISMWNPRWHLDGSYAQNLRTDDFRIRGRGTLDPGTLDPYIDKWWLQVWEFVVPGELWPNADIDYQGCWDNLSNQTLYGSVNLQGARAKGVLMDDLALRIYLRHDVVAVYDLEAQESGGGNLTGAMLWLKLPPYHKNYEQRYLFESTLPLASAAALAGNTVVELTRPLVCPTPPQIFVDQRTGGSSNPQANVTVTKIRASLGAPFKAYNVPLDYLEGNATIYDGFTDIPELDFGIADGAAKAVATVTHLTAGNELAFNITLAAGHHTGVLYALSQMKEPDEAAAANATVTPAGNETTPAASAAATAPTPAEAAPAPHPANMANDLSRPGKMDLTLGARVLLGHAETFAATGHARIYEAKLGQLQLFGPLSSLLSGTFLPIGSLDLDGASSDIQIANHHARFPNLIVSGPSARIVAAGLYNFSDEQTSFLALLFPMGSWNVPVVSQIVDIFSTVNNTVTIELTGNLDAPHYSVGMNPLRMFSARTLKAPPIPGYPANPDGSPAIPALPFPPPAMTPGPTPTATEAQPAVPNPPPPVNPSPGGYGPPRLSRGT